MIADNLAAVRARIDIACRESGRDPSRVRLLPMSKTHPVQLIREAHAVGLTRFGESRPQELAEKCAELSGLGIEFAMAGQLQSNKAKLVAEHAVEFQALSSLRLAGELDRRCQLNGRQLEVLIQVNTSGEQQKNGIDPKETIAFARALSAFDALIPRGFMTMAMNSSDQMAVGGCFDQLAEVQRRVRDAGIPGDWDELSMGMSGDFELAIARGSTCVRIGTAIFGTR